MNEALVAASAAVMAALVSSVGAVLASRAEKNSRSNAELLTDVRELRRAVMRHLENHP